MINNQITPKYSVLICSNSIINLKEVISSIIHASNFTSNSVEIVLVRNGKLFQADLNFEHKNLYIYDSVFEQLTSSLNFGLNMCNGTYIVRMDADDLMTYDRFLRLDDAIISNPTADIIAGNALLNNGDVIKSLPSLKYIILGRSPFIHPSICIKKSTLIKLKGYSGFDLAQDYYLACNLFFNNCIYYYDNNIYLKYSTDSSKVLSKKRKSYNSQLSYMLFFSLQYKSIFMFTFFIIKYVYTRFILLLGKFL